MTLDPFFPESVIGKKYFGALLTHLPDPCVFERYDSCEVPELAGKFKKMLQGRRVFLLFGFLTERKGVLKILDAMKHLPGEVGKGICIIFAGKVSPEIRCNIDEVFKRQPVVEINGAAFLLIDRFLSDGELRRLVETADVLLAPYQNFVGSSGVLLWAAGAGKPVITQSYGLLGALTERYNLGKAVDTSDASALAEAIGSFALGESPIHWNKSKMSLLAETSNPDRFCRHFFRFS